MRNLKLRKKLIVSVSLLILITTVILTAIAYLSLGNAYNRVITATNAKLDQIIVSQIDGLIGVLQANHQRYLDGEITEAQAIETAKYLVRSTKYNNGIGYFWADMEDGTNAVHINVSVEGTNRWNTQDQQGNYFVQDTINAGNQKDGGFIEFYFAKPGESQAKEKRGFVRKFEPYGWYVGTGNYQEDMLPLIQAEINEANKSRNTALLLLSGVGVVTLLAGICCMWVLAGKIAAPIESATIRLQQLSKGNLSDEVEVINSKDEVGVLTNSLSDTVQIMRSYISNISKLLEELSNGILTTQIELEYVGDFRSIKSSFLHTMEVLSHTFSQIQQSSEQVSSGSDQVSAGAQALSQGATEQASSVEELSATITEITGKITDNAQNAAAAKNQSQLASGEVSNSNKKMTEMIDAIGQIGSKSNEISKIIKVIEDIAFQTNILALNAAVEAARAGTAGKGFAVVADEVRNLAAKSAEAAKNTTALIEETVQSVENGTQIADQTAKAMLSVVEGNQKVTQIIEEIAKASEEQANAIAQVSQGVDQVSAVIQTNSATAEESAAASEELSGQAQMLKHLISKFHTKDSAPQNVSPVYKPETEVPFLQNMKY